MITLHVFLESFLSCVKALNSILNVEPLRRAFIYPLKSRKVSQLNSLKTHIEDKNLYIL
jgi:hypothetical protein